MRTFVYVDGFNFYYGCLKGSSHKWLDLESFCSKMLPTNDVVQIRYFTALITPRPGQPDQAERQKTYLRALATLPCVSVHRGHFLSHRVRMRLATPIAGQKYADVIKTEEKGSDVNIATHLLCDAYENQFDVAVLITNDSDLLAPVQVVSQRLGKKVGILNPHKNPSFDLKTAATFLKRIRQGPLRDSQFPEHMADSAGAFSRPTGW